MKMKLNKNKMFTGSQCSENQRVINKKLVPGQTVYCQQKMLDLMHQINDSKIMSFHLKNVSYMNV